MKKDTKQSVYPATHFANPGYVFRTCRGWLFSPYERDIGKRGVFVCHADYEADYVFSLYFVQQQPGSLLRKKTG